MTFLHCYKFIAQCKILCENKGIYFRIKNNTIYQIIRREGV